MGLETAAYQGGDAGDGDDAAAPALRGHLAGGGLAGVEGAVEVYADG